MQIGSVEALKAQMEKCIVSDCKDCPYTDAQICDTAMTKDALEYIESLEERIAIMQESMEALEKRCNALEALEQRCKALEQRNEPIEPIVVPIGEDVSIPFIRYKCPKCGMFQIEFKPNYCSGCGQAVKWE